MQPEAGTIALGERDTIVISVESEQYFLTDEDVRTLLFYGKLAPVSQAHRIIRDDGTEAVTISIEGYAAINTAGKGVKIFTRVGYYIIPLVSFQRVARGEAVSAPLFPLIPEYPGGSG